MSLNFFVVRPIFSSVCSIAILLAGLFTLPTLPVSEYPNITPPEVRVTATYTGASAEAVESAVTAPLEQQINGVEGMKYIISSSTSNGQSTVTITFDLDRDIDLAAVDVQNRVATVEGRLPAEVRARGVSVEKVFSNFVLVIGLTSDRYPNQFLSNYADLYLRDALKRVKGVGDVQIYGELKFAMRLWLDPEKLARRGITSLDVVKALREQNIQVPAGQVGQRPQAADQMYQISVRAKGRLEKPEEFEQIVVRSTGPGDVVKIKDVGRVELGAEDYNNTILRFNGKESVGLGIYPLPNANALEISEGVRAEMERLKTKFPPGMGYQFALDTTRSVNEAIFEVLKTLVEAVLLVVLVMFLFLQSFRITLIPALTIPIALVGTFAILKLFGYSINTLTLFGITLATGLVVDDAIVVIENIERVMKEKSLSALSAAQESLKEIAGAVIATTLVLGAVFVPVTLFPGTTGQLYRQFAVTIAISVGISAFIALTLTPALSVLLLRRRATSHDGGWRYLAWFNRLLEWVRKKYEISLKFALRWRWAGVALFLAGLGLTFYLYKTVPNGFLPTEDQGWFIITLQGPEGVSFRQTEQAVLAVEKELSEIPEITEVFSVQGFNFSGNGANKATFWVSLKEWREREKSEQSVLAILQKLQGKFANITAATVTAFPPPAIQGLGSVGGFQLKVQDLTGAGLEELDRATQSLTAEGNRNANLQGLYTSFRANSPQLLVEVDRDRAKALGVDLEEIFGALSINLGSQYVNDFDLFNRSYRVFVQADEQFRATPADLTKLYVRSRQNEMIPLGSVVRVKKETAPQTITHYNLYRAAEINGSPRSGISSGQAIQTMSELADRTLPLGMGYEWSGISLEESAAGQQAYIFFALGILCLFLILAAQYESLAAPLIILFSVPLAVLGALAGQWLRGFPNDIFCQIGLVMLIGLSSKNGILIVEFANQLRAEGLSASDAVLQAAQTRLRPILMTSLAFICGLLPLVFSTGAGAVARQSLGTAVLGGMIVSTLLNLFVIPVFYVLLTRVRKMPVPIGVEPPIDFFLQPDARPIGNWTDEDFEVEINSTVGETKAAPSSAIEADDEQEIPELLKGTTSAGEIKTSASEIGIAAPTNSDSPESGGEVEQDNFQETSEGCVSETEGDQSGAAHRTIETELSDETSKSKTDKN